MFDWIGSAVDIFADAVFEVVINESLLSWTLFDDFFCDSSSWLVICWISVKIDVVSVSGSAEARFKVSCNTRKRCKSVAPVIFWKHNHWMRIRVHQELLTSTLSFSAVDSTRNSNLRKQIMRRNMNNRFHYLCLLMSPYVHRHYAFQTTVLSNQQEKSSFSPTNSKLEIFYSEIIGEWRSHLNIVIYGCEYRDKPCHQMDSVQDVLMWRECSSQIVIRKHLFLFHIGVVTVG